MLGKIFEVCVIWPLYILVWILLFVISLLIISAYFIIVLLVLITIPIWWPICYVLDKL